MFFVENIVVCVGDVLMGMEYNVLVDYFIFDNGLKVVLLLDNMLFIVMVVVYYNIGFRNEFRDCIGFVYLFEYMMFQGFENLGKMEFVKLVNDNGGVLNGLMCFDYINYFEIVLLYKLEIFLWVEVDCMKGLVIMQENLINQ